MYSSSDLTMLCMQLEKLNTESARYLCVAVVWVPAGSKTVLSSDVPNQEVTVTYFDLLNVAANGWWCVHSFLC